MRIWRYGKGQVPPERTQEPAGAPQEPAGAKPQEPAGAKDAFFPG